MLVMYVLCNPVILVICVLIISLQDHDFVRAPIVLHSISKLDQELIAHSATAIVKGLSLCLGGSQGLRHEIVNSPDFWSVIRALQAVPDVANAVFALVEDVVIGSASAVTTDNYEPIISMLGDYATTGSIGAQDEQRREVALRRGKGAPPKKTPLNPVVARGQRAVQLVYEATARVPHFIQQSHLEAQEGESNRLFCHVYKTNSRQHGQHTGHHLSARLSPNHLIHAAAFVSKLSAASNESSSPQHWRPIHPESPPPRPKHNPQIRNYHASSPSPAQSTSSPTPSSPSSPNSSSPRSGNPTPTAWATPASKAQ